MQIVLNVKVKLHCSMDYLGIVILVLIPKSKTHEHFKSDHAAGKTAGPERNRAIF